MSIIRTDADTTIEAQDKIAKFLSEPNGLEKVASMVLPDLIKKTRDYVGFGRKVLVVDTDISKKVIKTETGAFFVQYPKDIESGASFMGEEAEAPSYKIEGELVQVPILTIMSDDMTIDRKRLLLEKLDYLAIAQQKAGEAIAKLEDYKILAITEGAIMGVGSEASPTNAGQIVTTADTTLAKSHLISLKKTQTKHDLRTAAFVMNQATLEDMLGWENNELDDQTLRELLEQGVRYTIWKDISIITSRLIDEKHVFSYADKEFTGVIPLLQDVQVEMTATNTRLVKGLFIFEFIGFAIFNHRAVGKLILGYTSGNKLDLTKYTKQRAVTDVA